MYSCTAQLHTLLVRMIISQLVLLYCMSLLYSAELTPGFIGFIAIIKVSVMCLVLIVVRLLEASTLCKIL